MHKSLPYVYVKRIAKNGSNVKLHYCIKLDTSRMNKLLNSKAGKNLRILVVQITDPNIVGTISRSDKAIEKFVFDTKRGFGSRNPNYEIVSINNAKPIIVGNQIQLPFSTDFNIGTPSVSTLAYAFITFSEVNERKNIIGSLTIQKVVEGGNAVQTAAAFFLPTGEQWLGPIYRFGKTYTAGAQYTEDPRFKLTKKTVMNTIVQEEGLFSLLKSVEFNLSLIHI